MKTKFIDMGEAMGYCMAKKNDHDKVELRMVNNLHDIVTYIELSDTEVMMFAQFFNERAEEIRNRKG